MPPRLPDGLPLKSWETPGEGETSLWGQKPHTVHFWDACGAGLHSDDTIQGTGESNGGVLCLAQ